MDQNEFVRNREFLYHLTDTNNINSILDQRQLLSTTQLLEGTNIEFQEKNRLLKSRRQQHHAVSFNGYRIKIRDQKPLNIALEKCLTDNWTVGRYIKLLNDHVFFWPTVSRLSTHFKRYEEERPAILKMRTSDLFSLNTPYFCRLNSGATRPNSHLGGIPPKRGPNTFQLADNYMDRIYSIAEVTFHLKCTLPKYIELGFSPDGPWKEV